MDNDNEQEQPQPTAAPADPYAKLTVRVEGYHPNKPIGTLVRFIAEKAGMPLGNVPAADAEPIVSYVRWDHYAAEALEDLARITGAKWDVQGGALNFVIGG